MTDWSSEYLRMIEDCECRSLTEWEEGFIDSIRSQIEAGRRLTDTQVEKLDEVWERATSRG